MPTLSYCKSVNNCSPNLLHFKVAETRNFILALFSLLCVLALPCTFAYSYCTMPIMPCLAFCPRPALLLLCPLLICPPALPCPAMSSPALSSTALSSPALPAKFPISGRSDRKVLRLIYILYISIYIFRDRRFCSKLCLIFNCLSFP